MNPPKKSRFSYASEPVQPTEPEKPAETEMPTKPKESAKPRNQAEPTQTGVTAMTEKETVLTETSKPEMVIQVSKPGMQIESSEQSELIQSALLAESLHPRSTEGAFTLSLGDPNTMTLPPQRRGRRDEAGEGRMAIQREQLNVRVRPELKRAAAAVGALNGMTLGDVVEQALLDYLAKHR